MTTFRPSIPLVPPSVRVASLFAVLSALVCVAVSCDNAERAEGKDQSSEEIEQKQPSTTSFEDRLVGSWSLDRASTVSATKAAAENAGKGQTAMKAALRDYLENKATSEDATAIRELLAEGKSPEEIMAMVTALESTESPEEAVDQMISPIEHLDLAFDVKFDGKEFQTSESSRVWRYSVGEAEGPTDRAEVELRGYDGPWTMRIEIGESTLTINVDEEFFLNLGTPPDEISRLPVPMVFVFQRDPVRARQGEQD